MVGGLLLLASGCHVGSAGQAITVTGVGSEVKRVTLPPGGAYHVRSAISNPSSTGGCTFLGLDAIRVGVDTGKIITSRQHLGVVPPGSSFVEDYPLGLDGGYDYYVGGEPSDTCPWTITFTPM